MFYLAYEFRNVTFYGKPLSDFLHDPIVRIGLVWLPITIGVVWYVSYLEVKPYI